MDIKELKTEMPYKWKVQSVKQWGVDCVAYIDARQVMEKLDEVCGPGGWKDHYREVCGQVYCDLSIKCGDEWVTKSDCGKASAFEAEKGQASDAFKRAAVKWGVGRFLYTLDIVRLKSIELDKKDKYGKPTYAPCDNQGKRIYNVTAYINSLKPGQPKKTTQQIKDMILDVCKNFGLSRPQLKEILNEFGFTWKKLSHADAQFVYDQLIQGGKNG